MLNCEYSELYCMHIVPIKNKTIDNIAQPDSYKPNQTWLFVTLFPLLFGKRGVSLLENSWSTVTIQKLHYISHSPVQVKHQGFYSMLLSSFLPIYVIAPSLSVSYSYILGAESLLYLQIFLWQLWPHGELRGQKSTAVGLKFLASRAKRWSRCKEEGLAYRDKATSDKSWSERYRDINAAWHT